MTLHQRFRAAATNCAYRFYSLEYFFSSSQREGFDAVELWCGPMHFFMDYAANDSVSHIAALSKKSGLPICAICPEQNNPKPSNVAARGDDAIRRSRQHFKRAIDVAADLGAGMVSITSGWGFLDESRETAWDRSVRMLSTLGSYAGERGVTLALEALQPEESNLCNCVRDLRTMLEDVGSAHLKVLLDTGAMWRAGESVRDYMDAFGKDVVHCHFTDARETSHLAWGDGVRDMRGDLLALAEAGYSGCLTFESVDPRYFVDPAAADRQSLAALKRNLEEFDT